jgi:hypothetical protein
MKKSAAFRLAGSLAGKSNSSSIKTSVLTLAARAYAKRMIGVSSRLLRS